VREGKVTSMNIYGMDKAENVIQKIIVDPYGELAKELFTIK
jgi:hypothetical protein